MSTPLETCFSISKLSAAYANTGADSLVLNEINLDIPKGKLTTVIGPNGCGKSTLLKCLSQLITLKSGDIFLNGEPLIDLKRRSLAKLVTYLPQQPLAPKGISVFDLVSRGRTPHQSFFQQWQEEDQSAVDMSLEQVKLKDYSNHLVDELSGGQRQRAWIAMTLAQHTDIILLDEPTASLDPKHQMDVFKLLKAQCDEAGKTIVVVVHDLNMALQFSDHVVVLRDGKLINSGNTKETLTTKTIKIAFDLDCEITKASDRNIHAVIPFA